MDTRHASLPPDYLLAQMGWVRELARGLLSNPSDADDVAQEVWLAASARPPRSASNLRAWLAVVTRHLVHSQHRVEVRRRRREAAAARHGSELAVDAALIRGETSRRVVDAVMKLDEPYRATVLRRYLDGFSTAEISEQDGIPEPTVRQRLSRGLEHLRTRLDIEFEGDRSAWSAVLVPLAHASRSSVQAGSLPALKLVGGVTMGKSVTLAGSLALLGGIGLCGGLIWGLWRFSSRIAETAPALAEQPDSVHRDSPTSANASDSPGAKPTERTAVTEDAPSNAIPVPVDETPDEGLEVKGALEKCFGTFLTDHPDVQGLATLFRTVADKMVIDPGSLHTSPDGVRTGTFHVGQSVSGRVTIDSDRYKIAFDAGLSPQAKQKYVARDVTMSLRNDLGLPADMAMGVQYHPDTGRPPTEILGSSSEVLTGWVVQMTDDGVVAQPLSVRAGPNNRGFTIGHASGVPVLKQEWITDTSAYAAALAKLKGL